MIEAYGNIWDNFQNFDAVLITTNGFVKTNGEAVMGRGIALQAKERFPTLARKLGKSLLHIGNFPFYYSVIDRTDETLRNVLTLPVKPVYGPKGEPGWRAKADIGLIEESLKGLLDLVNFYYIDTVIMPRPGCGNGGLKWVQVKKVIEPYLDDRFTVMEYND